MIRTLAGLSLLAAAGAASADGLAVGKYAGVISFTPRPVNATLEVTAIDGNHVKGKLTAIVPRGYYPCTAGEHPVVGTFADNQLDLHEEKGAGMKGCDTHMKMTSDNGHLSGTYNGQWQIDLKP